MKQVPLSRLFLNLKDFQEEGVDWVLRPELKLHGKMNKVLAWEPGTGKTVVSVESFRRSRARTALVFCPSSQLVKQQWVDHFIEWAGVGRNKIFVVNSFKDEIPPYQETPIVISGYELGVGRPGKVEDDQPRYIYNQLMKRLYGFFFLDEAHRVKGLTSTTSRLILSGGNRRALVGRAWHNVLLSGTMAPNRPIELFPTLRVLGPECIEEYLELEEYGKYFCAGFREKFLNKWNFKGASHVDELAERIKPLVNVVRLEDVWDEVPQLIETTFKVKVDLREFDNLPQYENYREDIDGNVDVVREPPMASLRRAVGIAKMPYVIEYLKDRASANPREKVVVFGYTRDVVSGIRKALGEKARAILGAMPSRARQAALDWFVNDHDARWLVLQWGAAGVGLNRVQLASNVCVFAEVDWTPGVISQAIGRVLRLGQSEEKVFAIFVVARNVEQEMRMVGSCNGKERVLDKLFPPSIRPVEIRAGPVVWKKPSVNQVHTNLKSVHYAEKEQQMGILEDIQAQLSRIEKAIGVKTADKEAPKTKTKTEEKAAPAKKKKLTLDDVRRPANEGMKLRGNSQESEVAVKKILKRITGQSAFKNIPEDKFEECISAFVEWNKKAPKKKVQEEEPEDEEEESAEDESDESEEEEEEESEEEDEDLTV